MRGELENLQLTILWQNPDHRIQTVDYTHCSIVNNVAYYSTIDHFAMSARLLSIVTEAGVIHSGENLSNHSAIFAKLRVGELDLQLDFDSPNVWSCWVKANEEAKGHFKSTLANQLHEIPEFECFSCQDVLCQASTHREDIEEYTLNILEAMENAGNECLPKSGCGGTANKRPKIPGWSEHVKPYSVECNFWYCVWLSAGKPPTGDLFMNMKQSKRQFKFAVRRLKKCKDKIQDEKFVSSLLQGGANIFQEIRKTRGKTATFRSRIDDEVGAHNIAEHFAVIYENLYNKVDLGVNFEK